MIKKLSEQKAILQIMKKSSSQNEQDLCSDFDQYVLEKVSKHNQSWMQIVPLEGIIKKQLKRGFSKKTIYSYLIDKKLINCTYNTFYNFISKLEKKDPTKDKVKTDSIPKTQQITQEDTATQTKEVQKPEEQETNPTPKETQTTQTVEPEKSDALKRIEEHRQRVQAQRAAEATTETKPEQQIETNAQQDTQETEEREFGKLPKGKVWSELSEELKETIRSERRQLDAEEREKRKQQQIEAAVAEREASKLHHNPNT
ncbi:MAG: hypothetical protein IIT54_03375 [Acetobacter sp.]|nr:hypothetical protein [Acetobacter sp.]